MNTFYWQNKELWGNSRQPARWEAEIIDSALQEIEPLTCGDEDKLLELSNKQTQLYSGDNWKNCYDPTLDDTRTRAQIKGNPQTVKGDGEENAEHLRQPLVVRSEN